MIGSGLKKLARQHNMTIDSGVAYGSYYGYATMLHEGSGWKAIVVSCTFPDGQRMAQLQAMLDDRNLRKEFRILQLTLAPNGIHIQFHDTPGTMKKMIAFSEWFFPQLESYGVTGADICTMCGQPHDDTSEWQLVDGLAMKLHAGCTQRLQQNEDRKAQLEAENAAEQSYFTGFIGALLGGLLGAVIWGAVLYWGYYASIVGIAIGLLASKGYDLFAGKQKKGKIVIVLLVTILSVIIGTLGAYEFELLRLISTGEFPGYAYTDSLWMLLDLCLDPEFGASLLSEIGMGMFYGLLGAAVILLRIHKDTKTFKMKQLK